ncbi:CHAD domain-containing protein [Paracoccus sp. Z330]|uniref:CHAD domain-containing protein n=1 Tax=Paracoccus onchidii TaxID=3017813 RepID=A0ABT4ZKQ5_9RHOB|nr:CHAD domain-containing protein [Paracoccus onchidii]MDB6179310.1 CHAD domain-containing protein [Paracoccus onchidii]
MARHDTVDFMILADSPQTLFAEQVAKLQPQLEEDVKTGFALLDNFDGDLRQSGRALLWMGDGLLLLDDRAASLFQALPGNQRFVADLPDGPVKNALADLPDLRCLLELTSGSLSRRNGALVDDEGKTRTRFTLLELHGTDGNVMLVQTEKLRGYEKAHGQLQAYLLAAADGGSGATAHIYHALVPDHLPYIAKPKTVFAPDEKAVVAATHVISAYLAVAQRNEEGIIADLDTEFLHDYRVALRKIRSVLSLFRGVYSDSQTVALKRSFSELMAPTGRLRDIDVYLMERDDYYRLLPESLHGGLEEMFGRFQKSRKSELRKLTRRFEGQAYARQMTSLQALFSDTSRLHMGPAAERPVHEYARELIWKRYRKVCKMGRAIDDNTPDELVHELRINCKKLRYLMEFFAPLFSRKEVKARINDLKGLQDNLGLFNDYSVQQVALQEVLDRAKMSDRGKKLDMAKSVGALIAILHQRQLDERARVTRSFAEFDSAAVQDSFRNQFQKVTA